MGDSILLVATVAFFALSAVYVRGCERLGRARHDRHAWLGLVTLGVFGYCSMRCSFRRSSDDCAVVVQASFVGTCRAR